MTTPRRKCPPDEAITYRRRICHNGDGRPVQPPSRVLCRECLDALTEKIARMCEHRDMQVNQ